MMRAGQRVDELGRQDLHVAGEHHQVDRQLAQQALRAPPPRAACRRRRSGCARSGRRSARPRSAGPRGSRRPRPDRRPARPAGGPAAGRRGSAATGWRTRRRAAARRSRSPPSRGRNASPASSSAAWICGRASLKPRQIPHEPHEEQARLDLGVLVGVQDVAAVLEHELGQRRDQPGAIAAAHEQRRCHGRRRRGGRHASIASIHAANATPQQAAPRRARGAATARGPGPAGQPWSSRRRW